MWVLLQGWYHCCCLVTENKQFPPDYWPLSFSLWSFQRCLVSSIFCCNYFCTDGKGGRLLQGMADVRAGLGSFGVAFTLYFYTSALRLVELWESMLCPLTVRDPKLWMLFCVPDVKNGADIRSNGGWWIVPVAGQTRAWLEENHSGRGVLHYCFGCNWFLFMLMCGAGGGSPVPVENTGWMCKAAGNCRSQNPGMETSSSSHGWGDILREIIYHSLQVLRDKRVSSHNFTFPWVLVAICVSGSWRAAFNEKHSSIQGSFSVAAPNKQDVFSWCVPDIHVGVHILETATCTQPSSTASLLFPYLLSCEFPYAPVELLLIKSNHLSRCWRKQWAGNKDDLGHVLPDILYSRFVLLRFFIPADIHQEGSSSTRTRNFKLWRTDFQIIQKKCIVQNIPHLTNPAT